MSDPVSPKHRIESMHMTHSYEFDQIHSQLVEPKNEGSNVNQKFPIDLSGFEEVPLSNNPNPRKTIFIVLGILAIIGGIFVAYKRKKTTLPPIQNTPPLKRYHLTGKIRTTINPQ